MEVLRQLKIELRYDPGIPQLGIYPEKTIIQKESCTIMFTAALFTIVRTWKQPKCPSTEMDEDVVHIYSGILLTHKRNEIGSFVETWMDLETVIKNEVSQKEKNIVY